jgi:ribosome-associated protein
MESASKATKTTTRDVSEARQAAIATARKLDEQKANDIVVVDISQQSSFADYFVIATAQSFGHLRGLVRSVDEAMLDLGLRAKGVSRGVHEDDTWILLDCGDVVVHLMSPEAREFYALEKLWFESPKVAYN